MTVEARKHGAINLAQGMPDFPAPPRSRPRPAAHRKRHQPVRDHLGLENLREAVAEHAGWHLGLAVDPETEITVTCGSTEAMLVSLLSLINPGDEVILTQPFYENYWPDCVLAGATPRFVPLRPPAGGSTPTSWRRHSPTRPRRSFCATPITRPARFFPRRSRRGGRALPQMGCDRDHRRIYEHIIYDGRPTSPWPRSTGCASDR